ncbi:class I SAM-dependent methyltransferase [Luteipulveratus halotolerans]|uniref:Methyltransferase type 11 domain-containing protein n=1 Tax=Luteipulveratus halotolerans TaxID=1631356 RepID=A0A0L6CNH3_9MICO|nr:class I SAM-dependent methyltransferase [Luteipulveratus halotolerans]KNX39336.1 hypothetical protein VV01_09220 [Luteipulveratus halotolerans]
MPRTRHELEAELVAYYDQEVTALRDREVEPRRTQARSCFVEILEREGRDALLEVGAGPGRDGVAFQAAGLAYVGVDLASASVAACTAIGLDVRVGTVHDLPWPDRTFDAVWTMSTLLQVPDLDLGSALGEVTRVARPGAPIAIGLWGAPESREQYFGDRFFSLRSDDDLCARLADHGTVEQLITWPGEGDLHYQWVVLRRTG